MDPKSIANLDPKLRETYERVMGSAPVAPSSPDNQAAPMSPMSNAASDISASPIAPTPPPDLSAPMSPEPQLSSSLSSLTPSPTTGASIPSSTPYSPADLGLSPASQPSPATEMQPLASPASVAQTSQNTGPLIKILYIFGGIIFFVVYVFFWVKIFNYTLPF